MCISSIRNKEISAAERRWLVNSTGPQLNGHYPERQAFIGHSRTRAFEIAIATVAARSGQR
jgi:hypothetical protein